MKRVLTAIVALPILLFTVWTSSPYYFVALAVIAAIIALSEFYALASKSGFEPMSYLGYLAVPLIALCFVLDHRPWVIGGLSALGLGSVALALLRADRMDRALGSVAATLFGVVYVGFTAGFMTGVRFVGDEFTQPPTTNLAAKLLTMFFAMVILTDTGAYYVGRGIGRHKLAPRISPGKTVEGAIGGFIFAVAAGPLSRLTFFPEIPLWNSIALGAVIGCAGQVGDLAESMLKRGADVKDSGTLLPGHGGMLDRIDSILFCAPILYYYSRLFLSRF
jgi:phosphatidate cytidylyltransferase